jgi:rod shape-determining protein MreB
MHGKTPAGIETVKPLRDGVISHPDVAVKLIRAFFEHIDAISFFSRPSVIVCVPYNITEVEKRAVEDVIFEAGARAVALIEEPIAAAIGIGLRVKGAKGNMIIDIGGGTTEVAVISLGGIVASTSIRIAGEEFDDSIISYLCRRRGIRIGESQAEELKLAIGSAHPSADKGFYEISGQNLENRLSTSMKISSQEIREAITPNLEQIIQAIKRTLEQTPPELSSDIYDYGITLTGGGALLRGIDRLITERTGLNVKIAPRPLDSVCLGIFKIIESEGKMGSLLQYRGR